MPETSQDTKFLDEAFRDYAWRYFELHTEQRLKAFQFFITLSTAIVGGSLLLVRYGQGHKWMAVLGFLLAFFSFVFWKLDVRTGTLVKNGEEALKFLDAKHQLPTIDGAPHPLAMFARDDHFTSRAKKRAKKFHLFSGHFSYHRCFKYVFVMFAFLGYVFVIAVLSVF